jgi:hypothetical protein
MRLPRCFRLSARVWVAALGLLAVGPAVIPLRAQISPTYEEPDFTSPVFDPDRLSLEPPVRRRLADLLAAVVTNFDPSLDAKILGIALRLDPANRPAREAAERRKKGELPDERQPKPPYSANTVSNYLAGQSAGLRAKGGADNIALAGFLNEIAVEIDPDNPVAKHEKTAYGKSYPPAAWTFLKSQPPAVREKLPLLKKQSKIRGLGITELPNGEETGGVLEMIITAEEARNRQEVGFSVAQPVGASMRTAFEEAVRTVRLRHPSFGDRQHLTLSFAEKYGGKDGPSAGTAFTLLLYSLYDPLRLAGDCAITGDITVDGRVRRVGAVPSKIHAALLDQCRIVAIPKENADAVGDVPFLYPMNTVWNLQIFTVDTIDQAIAVMRADRPADLQQAIVLFAGVQQLVGLNAPRLTSANAAAIPLLKEVLRLAPNHASADYMLKCLQGKAPGSLSLAASLDEVRRITQATVRLAAPTKERPEIDQSAISNGLNRLEALRPQLDFRVSELCAADMAILRTLQKFDVHQPAEAQIAEYNQRVETIRTLEKRMSTDRALIEALRR